MEIHHLKKTSHGKVHGFITYRPDEREQAVTDGAVSMTKQHPDESPEYIARMCAEIQAGWSPEEKQRRLRCDLRPQVMTADGRLVDVTADAYEIHQVACDRLQDE